MNGSELREELDFTWVALAGLPRGLINNIFLSVKRNNPVGLIAVKHLMARTGATVVTDPNGNVVCGWLGAMVALAKLENDIDVNVEIKRDDSLDCNENPRACVDRLIACPEMQVAALMSDIPITISIKGRVVEVSMLDLMIYALKTYYTVDAISEMLGVGRDVLIKSLALLAGSNLGGDEGVRRGARESVRIPLNGKSKMEIMAELYLGSHIVESVFGSNVKARRRYLRMVWESMKRKEPPPPPTVVESGRDGGGGELLKVEVSNGSKPNSPPNGSA